MNIARELERRLENLVDGASASVFRGRMHPVDIATRVVRQLEYLSTETPAGPQVPNDLMVSMNAADIDPQLDRSALTTELGNVLTQTAADRGWRVLGRMHIQLRSDESTPRGIVECIGTTSRSPLDPWCQLIADDGSAVLAISLNRTLIGRDLDCDIRIANQQISRHHAVVYREGGTAFARDLGSSNGTTVNGIRALSEPVSILAGDNVILGDLSFTSRMVT
ncbi:MAG: FhaA domain-containing protein [Acidimicrobiia bacterium]